MDKPIVIVDIDPVHLSTRERALRAIYGVPAVDMLLTIEPPPRPVDLEIPVKVRAPKAMFERAPKRKEFHKEKSASLKRLLAK